MEGVRKACPACLAPNSIGARWCARCYQPLELAAQEASAETRDEQPISTLRSQAASQARLKLWITRLALLGLVVAGINLQLDEPSPSFAAGDVVEGGQSPLGYGARFVDAETGDAVRYDPCTPIHYVVNPALAPDGGLEDVHTAMRLTAEASGLDFVYDGETDEAPSATRPTYLPDRYGERWAPVLIAWSNDMSAAAPAGTDWQTLGLAGSSFERNEDGELVYVSGQAVFNAGAGLKSGFAGETWGQVILHEIGHIVGLNHVSDPQSVMNPVHGLRPAAWGHGDRRGLWELGLGSGCLSPPNLP